MFIISLQINVVHALNSQIEDTNTLARMAYNAACNIDGLGPVKALIAVQLAGAMGIANAVYCLWGLVPIKGKNSGTYKFFNKYYPSTDPTLESITEENANLHFLELHDLIQMHSDPRFEKSQLEVSCCELARGKRKKDIIFCDSEANTIQNFFRVKRTSSTTAELKFLRKGRWNCVHDLYLPYNMMTNTNDDEELNFLWDNKDAKLKGWVRESKNHKAELCIDIYK
jgi:hypothetical protein